MKVCIIGGGNIGTLLVAELGAKNYDVVLYTSHYSEWSSEISVFDSNNVLLFSTDHFSVTDNLQFAVSDAAMICITYPAYLFSELAQRLTGLLKPGQVLVCIPGCGGAEFAFSELIRKGIILCGFQRVHCITRIRKIGKEVYALGRKESVQIASIPSSCAGKLSEIISSMLSMRCDPLPNYLNVTLVPSNSILHTTRLYTLFKEYKEGNTYPRNYLFYEEWTNEASELLLLCDSELQEICKRLSQFQLTYVKSLRIHYESNTADELTKKISKIAAFRGILSPMKKTTNGWIPDFTSRYFTADFPFGLKVLIDIAKSVEANVPNMLKIWKWYASIVNVDSTVYPMLDFSIYY